jgi:hypothetical protein
MDRSQNGRRIYHKLIIGLYAIVFAIPATAQQAPSNTNIAGPSASATGNVTNQAVQVLQGPFAMNTYGAGVSCQGPTLNLQTFGYNSLSNNSDPTSYQQNSFNGGVSAGFSVPLDGSFQELCKARVRTEITRQQAEADKARLDFELVRLLKCGEAIKSGISFHPESPYAKICADVVVKYPKVQDVVNGNTTNKVSKN